MPPKKSNTLTEAELRLMKILWRRGESAVNDLVAAMPEGEPLAYNSVLTTIRILEQKGYVEHRQEGRAFVYRPCAGARGESERSEARAEPVLWQLAGAAAVITAGRWRDFAGRAGTAEDGDSSADTR